MSFKEFCRIFFKLTKCSIFAKIKQNKFIYLKNPDSIIFSENDVIQVDPMFYNGRKICIRTYWIVNALKEERYVPGCGMVFNGWYVLPGSVCDVQDSLIFYSKGNENWGNSLLSFNSPAKTPARLETSIEC